MAPKKTPLQRQQEAEARAAVRLRRARIEQYPAEIYSVMTALNDNPTLANSVIKHLRSDGGKFEELGVKASMQ